MTHERARGRWDALQYAAIALLTAMVLVQLVHSWRGAAGEPRDASLTRDFKAFYCAGAVVNAGEDPYRNAPLQRCGSRTGAVPAFAQTGVWPAPLPGYDLALFRAFALLPYRTAAIAFLALSVAAAFVTIVLVARMSAAPPIVVFAAVAPVLVFGCLEWGQLPPLLACALAVAAYAARARRDTVAALACVLAMIEPHVGLPVCVAAFLWLPRYRFAIAAGMVVLAVLSVATIGIADNLEYARSVLPLHARAEAPAVNQFSLTWIAHVLGAPDGLATLLGSVDYAAMTVLAVVLAGRIARSNDAPEAVALVPPPVVLLGGTFVHATQIAVTIACGLVLASIVARARGLIWLGVVLVTPIWYDGAWTRLVSASRIECAVAVGIVAYAAFRALRANAAVPRAALAAAAYLVVAVALPRVPPTIVRASPDVAAYARANQADAALAPVAWGEWIRATPAASTATLPPTAGKVPLWLGLLAMIGGIAANARRGLVTSPAYQRPQKPNRKPTWTGGPGA